jgi:flavin reductase (DIM6/NTAB) family NADH-FMN oxidoreductase RutF
VKRSIEPAMLYFGTPVVLVSSFNEDGTTNIAPMSSAWWIGRSAMLGLSLHSHTVANLSRIPECVLNLVDVSMVDAIDRLALLTGRRDVPGYKVARGYTYESEKFAVAGLTPASIGASHPLAVAQSKIVLRATVRRVHEIDAPGAGLRALEANVTETIVDADLLLPGERNHFDPRAWNPLIMKFTEYFASDLEPVRPSALAEGWGMPDIHRSRVTVA